MTAPADMTATPRLDRLRQNLPEQQRALLLKDSVFELTAAWKFFTRLPAGLPVFFCLSGYSAMPLAFARHVARVEVFGLSPEEQKLLAEVAHAKAISNIKFVSTPAEAQPPYATIIFMPDRESLHARSWQEMKARLQSGSNGREEYWVILRAPERRRLVRRGKRFLRKILQRQKFALEPEAPRLGFAASRLLNVASAQKFLPPHSPAERLRLELSPRFSAPNHVSVATEFLPAFSSLRASSTHLVEHVICGQRPGAQNFSYLERLLAHLQSLLQQAWQPAGALRVLPGGKVQIILRTGDSSHAAAALLKLPLIPHAAVRMRENALHLLRLARAEELSQAQRAFFPCNLAEGQFEKQAFFLETFLPGRSLDQMPAAACSPRQLEIIWQSWFDIQQRLARPVKINEAVFAGLCGDHVRRLKTWLAPAAADTRRLQQVLEYCRNAWMGRELKLGLVHGDFSIKNILVQAATQQITGVIDWDLADFFSSPLLDVLHFFVRLDERSFREPAPAIALRLIKSRQGRHAHHFAQACGGFGYPEKDWPALVILYWLFRLRGYLGSAKNTDGKFVRRQFSDMLALFEREVLSRKSGVFA